jgi:hypothetical protein
MVSATPMTALACPSTASHIAVLASSCSACALATSPLRWTPSRSISRKLPRRTERPSTSATDAMPGNAGKAWPARQNQPLFPRRPHNRLAQRMLRPALGAGRQAATRNSDGRCSGSEIRKPNPEIRSSEITTSVTAGSPRVIVPVLSSTMALSFWTCSSAALFLNRMPFSAPLPTPTMMEVGVASPMAHGQAMTRTAVSRINAGTKPAPSSAARRRRSARPRHDKRHKISRHPVHHALNGRFAALRLLHQPDNLGQSGLFAHLGGLKLQQPLLVERRADDGVARLFLTGSASPVIMLSSKRNGRLPPRHPPESSHPAARAPHRPAPPRRWECPLPDRCARRGPFWPASRSSFLIASLVRPLARASSSLPSTMRVMITAEVSK